MIGPERALAALLLGAVLAAAASPASASAGDHELGLSRDGRTWSSTLMSPLFSSAFRWVPGDSQTRSFFVRNQSADRADLSVDMLGAGADELMQTGDLYVSARTAGGHWQEVSTPGRHRLLSAVKVAPGRRQQVAVTVAVDPAATNRSQLEKLALRLRVTLSQDTAAAPQHQGALLPGTGAGRYGWAVLIAASLLGSGAALVAFGGRRRGNPADA